MATKTISKTPLQGAQIKLLADAGIKGKKTVEEASTEVISRLEKHGLDKSVIEDEELEILIDMLNEFNGVEEEAEELEELADEIEEEEELEEELEEEELEEEEDLEEEFEEEPVVKKGAAKPTINKASTASAKTISKSTTASVSKAKSSVASDKFDARNDSSHLEYLKPFKKFFPEKDGFQFDILKQGFTIRFATGNTKQTILNFDEVRIIDKGLTGNLYCNRFKNVDDLIKILPEELQDNEIGMFRGESHPCVRKITTEEILDVLENTDFKTISLSKAGAIDKRMVENRDKLESSLGIKKPAVAPVVKKPVAAPVTKSSAPTTTTKKVVVPTTKKIIVKKK